MNLAAFWDNLSNGNFSNILHAITHAHWSNLWAAISAIFTALAVIVAGWAMLRWRKQDELKAKLAFKKAVSDYVLRLITLPESVIGSKRVEFITELKELDALFKACDIAWVLSEGLMENNAKIKDSWAAMRVNHVIFVNGGKVEKLSIELPGMVILGHRFVFK